MIRIGRRKPLTTAAAEKLAETQLRHLPRKQGAYSTVFLDVDVAHVFVETSRAGAKSALSLIDSPHVVKIEYVCCNSDHTYFRAERLWPLDSQARKVAARIHREFWNALNSPPNVITGWCEMHAAAAVTASEALEIPALETLAVTIRNLVEVAYDLGLIIELNRRDILQRRDGTIVFADPFYVE